MKRAIAAMAGLAAVALGVLGAAVSMADSDGFESLFNGKDLSGWKTVPTKAEKTFMVQDGIIVVSGKPGGYFYTDKSYKNYVLQFDWRYKKPADLTDDSKFNGNSGLLVHIQPPHKVWPVSIEIQGENKTHGKIFGVGPASKLFKTESFDAKALRAARKPVGEWNTTEVMCKDGAIISKVNGTQVSTGKGELTEGPFGLQSEGAEIHFKNIRIKVLK